LKRSCEEKGKGTDGKRNGSKAVGWEKEEDRWMEGNMGRANLEGLKGIGGKEKETEE